ncbi:amidase [Rhizodiscina lignyota]|uniref:amidase n=1 Tax=Rhizodiscina lignyota TaxID=1504668 RepID=A0A9P4I2T2_9PEZI|nr:amidase [Rhizodiscina lignyota]
MAAKWETIAAAKRKALADSIPKEWIIPENIKPGDDVLDVTAWAEDTDWFSDEEKKITSTPAVELLEKLKTGELSAEVVTKAFCRRAAAAQQLTNCLTETMFDYAISTAKKLDAHLKSTGKPIGPLHGLPVSLKDNFNVKGLDSTVGFASLVNDPATYDATLVDILRDAGAVFYVKTNIPTAMMIAESVNNVFGRTLNPRNRKLTSGGSSGGESALLAFGGSVLGVGTDIGGSLRIPAACTGIYTLRPSFGRFPTLKCRAGLAGQEAVNSVNGPMSQHFSAVKLYSKTVVDSEPWLQDPKCIPIPWREVPRKEKLKIGVIWDDGIVKPLPPVTRALKETVEKLKSAGHEVVEWDTRLHAPLIAVMGKMFVADGGKSVEKLLQPTGEPFRPEMTQYQDAKEMGVYELWQLHLERTSLLKEYLDQWNACEGLDALLGPTTPYASPEHGNFKYVGYTGVFNVLDYSSTSFPTGFYADKEVDTIENPGQSALSDSCTETQKDYNPHVVHGAPISLQLTARKLEDEKVLMMTEVVLEALGIS